MRVVLVTAVQAFVFSLFVFQAPAQHERILLSGRVLDAQSMEPVSIASLQNGRELILTNVKGEFKIQTRSGDRLLISHTAYEPKIYVVSGKEAPTIEILLEEKLVDLFEVEISPFVTEEAFKNEVLNAVPRHDYRTSVMVRNQQMMKQIVPLAYDYKAMLKHAKSINDVSFLSTHPSVGLLKAIRQVKRRGFYSPPAPRRVPQEAWDPAWMRKYRNWEDYFEPQ